MTTREMNEMRPGVEYPKLVDRVKAGQMSPLYALCNMIRCCNTEDDISRAMQTSTAKELALILKGGQWKPEGFGGRKVIWNGKVMETTGRIRECGSSNPLYECYWPDGGYVWRHRFDLRFLDAEE